MTPATLDQASKEDLRDELLRIKQREKKLKEENKERTQKTIGAAITIGTGAILGHVIGGRVHDEMAKPDFADATDDEKTKRLDEAQNVFGVIPLDAAVGLVGIALGLSDVGGEFSSFLLAAGTGGVTSYATRAAYKAAETKKEEAPAA